MPENNEKEMIKQTYKEYAGTYDESVSERLGSARWGIETLVRLLLREMKPPKNPVALDVASGTGLSTFELAEQTGPGEYHGVDLSPEMVDKAQMNAESLGVKGIEFRVGDAESLPYGDDMFDLAICNMSFQFITDKPAALGEMYRVLKPGGRVGLLYGAGHHIAELLDICETVAQDYPDLTGLMDSINYIREIHIDIEETQRLLFEVGFRRPLVYGYHRVMHVNPQRFWARNPYPAHIRAAIPLDRRDEVETEIIKRLSDASSSRGYKLTWYTIQAYGSKPE
ncbi:MAG: class I SAM-dependent methyltransferase [Candidatus Bathyarchaeota archaeon]|nr:class I SAM-dependent methyltransferase [Candidatus Bathyarchaeota archaeon]